MLPGMTPIALPSRLEPADLAPFAAEAEGVVDAKAGDEAAC